MERYVCVHGHFYQPPRENPWLEVVEQEDEAYPFHDWNARITAECYAPNARARMLDGEGRITHLVNNYARMSFNVGPTLLSWMQDESPETYAGILEADRRSAERFGGHGSAMAQVYNHVIMPLATPEDQRTQIRWGIRDFRHRFGREPEGMWLAECAVDDTTLDLLAEHGIRFTVLSPYQAARIRAPDGEWHDVRDGSVDPTMPYEVLLPSGRTIAVFFYDGPISRAVAFEHLLDSGERFEQRLLDGFHGREGPQLVNIATDGESYGHHHRHGEMALAAALHRLADRDDVRVTNYAQYLALHPPTHRAEVVQASSWSCAHGVERWRADCGCGGSAERHQRWRAPLREALEWLREELDQRYAHHARALLHDPAAARDDYLDVVLDRVGNLDAFLEVHATGPLDDDQRTRVCRLLELQRHTLLMFTSCGWFFEELSRPEPVQVLRYAARAIQLARGLTGDDLEPAFVERLAAAESNDPRYGDGRGIHEQLVRPAVADLDQVGAHLAISGLTWPYGETERIGAYEVVQDDVTLHEAGRAKLAFGRLTVRSVVTLAVTHIEVAVLHLGDHNFTCGVRPRGDDRRYAAMCRELETAFDTADFPAVIRTIDEHGEGRTYSLRALFRDEQRRILDTVLATTLEEAEATHRLIYRGRAPLMRYLRELGVPLPTSLQAAAAIVLNGELREALSTTAVEPSHVAALLDEAERFEVELDGGGLGHTLSATIARLAGRVAAELGPDRGAVAGAPTSRPAEDPFAAFEDRHEQLLDRVRALIELVDVVPFEVDLIRAQNVLWRTLRDHHRGLVARARAGDEVAARWLDELSGVAAALRVALPGLDGVDGAPEAARVDPPRPPTIRSTS